MKPKTLRGIYDEIVIQSGKSMDMGTTAYHHYEYCRQLIQPLVKDMPRIRLLHDYRVVIIPDNPDDMIMENRFRALDENMQYQWRFTPAQLRAVADAIDNQLLEEKIGGS